MGQTGITVNQLPDLPAALQMIEEKTGSRPGGTEEKALCRLLSEELLMHLLRAGYTGICVSVRNLGSRAVMLTAPGEPDTLFTAQAGERAGGDAEETEVEINRNILGEFDGNIDYRYRRKKNIYTIYPGQKDSARITDEILDYYETENGGEKGAFGLLRFLARKHPDMAAAGSLLRLVRHLAALFLPRCFALCAIWRRCSCRCLPRTSSRLSAIRMPSSRRRSVEICCFRCWPWRST